MVCIESKKQQFFYKRIRNRYFKLPATVESFVYSSLVSDVGVRL